MRIFTVAAIASIMLSGCGEPADPDASVNSKSTQKQAVVTRTVDSTAGRALFVDKGCVICHAVNGVGGKAAPALDAEIGAGEVDPLGFAARMWLGAPAMIELQSVELGYSIFLTADEIANLAAFAADREQQETLTLDELPENIRNGLLDEQFWEVENWEEFLRTGREGDEFEEGEAPDEDTEE